MLNPTDVLGLPPLSPEIVGQNMLKLFVALTLASLVCTLLFSSILCICVGVD